MKIYVLSYRFALDITERQETHNLNLRLGRMSSNIFFCLPLRSRKDDENDDTTVHTALELHVN